MDGRQRKAGQSGPGCSGAGHRDFGFRSDSTTARTAPAIAEGASRNAGDRSRGKADGKLRGGAPAIIRESHSMLILIVHIHVKSEHLDAFREATIENARNSGQ